MPHGEQSKSLTELSAIYSFLVRAKVTRTDIVVALGGGVVGDLAGFAAATYLRGVEYVQIPTTLLAQVDSSVGGKTAVDIPEGKNLAGAFWQPSLVLCDVAALDTLTPETFADGAAEVIKYGAIGDAALFERLCGGALQTDTAAIIARCIDIKREMVEQDEFDNGARALLNFGHTLGHAVERESGYTVTHGRAVAIGMALMTAASERRGFTKTGSTARIIDCLARHALPVESPYALGTLFPHCLSDKKRTDDDITLIFIREIGDAFTHRVKTDVFKGILDL
ncbi:MAG: 3-dehydroquinate synthase [Acetanaerobacterium sp.]